MHRMDDEYVSVNKTNDLLLKGVDAMVDIRGVRSRGEKYLANLFLFVVR